MTYVIRHGSHGVVGSLILHQAGVTEADWIRWVGIALVIVGVVVAAPKGAKKVREHARRAVRRVSATVVKPFRRHRPEVRMLDVDIRAGLDVSGALVASPGEWDPEASAEEKARWLRLSLTILRSDMETQVGELRAKTAQQFDAMESALRVEIERINNQLAMDNKEAVFADARGLWLIGSGTALSGFSAGIGSWGVGGWVFLGVAVAGSAGTLGAGYGHGWRKASRSVWFGAMGSRFIALWVLLGTAIYGGLIVGGLWITHTPPIG